jgi:phage terminase large subunit GpA-like protein
MIYSIPTGDTYTSITDFDQPKVACPHCKQQTVMVSVFLKYNHINWFPMRTMGAATNIICTHCRGLDHATDFPDYIVKYAAEQVKHKSTTKRLLVTFAITFWVSLIAVVAVIISMFI